MDVRMAMRRILSCQIYVKLSFIAKFHSDLRKLQGHYKDVSIHSVNT